MNLLALLLEAKRGAVKQMAQRFGIGEDQARSVIGAVLPILARAMQENVKGGGVGGLLSALQSGKHEQYLESPAAQELSRKLATHVAARTGVSPAVIQQMLPILAGLLIGGGAGDRLEAPAKRANHQKGSSIDEILGMAGQFLGRK
jgi:hypothetical protein